MIFIKYNPLKSDIFSNPMFIPFFSGSIFFKVHVFQVQRFSGSRFLSVWVKGPDPGFRSNLDISLLTVF